MRQATKIVNNANDEQNSFRTWNMKTAQGQNDQTVKLLVYQVGMKVKDSLYENTFSILRYFMFFIQLQIICIFCTSLYSKNNNCIIYVK